MSSCPWSLSSPSSASLPARSTSCPPPPPPVITGLSAFSLTPALVAWRQSTSPSGAASPPPSRADPAQPASRGASRQHGRQRSRASVVRSFACRVPQQLLWRCPRHTAGVRCRCRRCLQRVPSQRFARAGRFVMDFDMERCRCCPRRRDYFKQSTPRLHFAADNVVTMTLDMFKDPKRVTQDYFQQSTPESFEQLQASGVADI